MQKSADSLTSVLLQDDGDKVVETKCYIQPLSEDVVFKEMSSDPKCKIRNHIGYVPQLPICTLKLDINKKHTFVQKAAGKHSQE